MTRRPKAKTKPKTAERSAPRARQRWRDYRTVAGNRPVNDFIATLTEEEAAALVAGMKEVAEEGLKLARHLRGEIYEVRADVAGRRLRVLFAQETKFILLALSGFWKSTKKTPPGEIDVADNRLADWRDRGKKRRARP